MLYYANFYCIFNVEMHNNILNVHEEEVGMAKKPEEEEDKDISI